GLFGSLFTPSNLFASNREKEIFEDKKTDDRKYWIELLDKISNPILANMSKGELQKNMKVEYSPIWDKRDKKVAYMEAFGRLIAGLAPIVTLPDDNSAESKIRARWRIQIQQSLAHAVDPKSPDYLQWGDNKTRQPLVDAAYIAQALLTAPKVLWEPLNKTTKDQIIYEFKKIRQIEPYNNNWVLFAATIESFLLFIGEEIDASRIDPAIETINKWYVGDGWYKDGEKFHFDHYNGYVIHPMLVEVLRVNVDKGRKDKALYETAYKRMQRYGEIQERYISPEGTFPVVGRSSTYRVGAFQPLAQLALDDKLPETVSPAQVRCALTAVMKRVFVPNTFNKEGFLTLGVVGDRQSAITDVYTNTGSLYITSLAFLPLGLPPTHKFWTDPFTEWTQLKVWSGKPIVRDHAVDY
nr:DUF2264 domain-containing protein [Pyrinomonadaceae bacterium]